MAKDKTAAGRCEVTIGCDVGDRKVELFVLQSDGTSERPEPVRTRAEEWRKFLQRPRVHLVLEVGTHSRWLARMAEEMGHEVTVANPRRLRLISQSDSKRDQSDAELLARLGRVDPKLLAPIQHRSAEQHADLAVPKARDVLIACRTRLVNHIRGAVKSSGERLARCTAQTFAARQQGALPPSLQPALGPLLATLRELEKQISLLDEEVTQVAKRYPDVAVMKQIYGVGVLTSLVFLLTLGDKQRFRKSRVVGAYLGLRPRQDQSGDIDKQLGITKSGDPMVRRLLVNCANTILRPNSRDTDLKRWGLSLCARGGKNARRRAKVAVARKLAVMMHRLWVTGEDYQALGYKNA